MIKNYFITAWRNINRQKSFSAINIFGLAIGLACCLILLAFVRQELSYDHFHTNSNRIFRVAQRVDGNQNWAWTGGAVAPIMVKEFELDAEQVQLDANLYEDLDLDSIDAVDLVVKLRELTGKKIEPDAFKAVRTVANVVDEVYALIDA